MKKTFVALVLLASLVAIPAMAQDAHGEQGSPAIRSEADFNSPRPQFLAFHFGLPLGYSMYGNGGFVAGFSLGFDFAILDNLSIGFDHMNVTGEHDAFGVNLLRMGFSFMDIAGAAIGFGAMDAGSTMAISLGAFGNFFQGRSALGLVYSLGLRIDFVTEAQDFGDGAIVFTLRTTLGI